MEQQETKQSRNWKSYFLEFLMIFLAVVLGFLAESYRNQLADAKKAEQLKKAIALDLKKDMKQLEEYNAQIDFILSRIDRMDSLLDQNPMEVDQKDYYNTLVNYSVFYTFSPSDKSLNEAESLGLIQNNQEEALTFYLLKYQYFLKDLKLVEGLIFDSYMDYLKDLVPSLADSKLYRKVWTYPLSELESKKGVAPISAETRKQLDFFFAQATMGYRMLQVDADSIRFYAQKIKDEIEK